MTQTASTAASTVSAYDQLIAHVREMSLVGSTIGLLSWDQETMMPPGGVAYRSEQIARLSALTHRMRVDPRVGDWLSACESDPSLTADARSAEAVNLREIRRAYDRATKLPESLVETFARTTAQARHAWAAARKASDFAVFKPWLEQIVELNRQRAACYGWDADGEPWDALAEGYEHGLTARAVTQVFTPLRDQLAKLVAALADSPRPPADRFNKVVLPREAQMAFVRHVTQAMGFDYQRGRLDISTHPFCGGTHRDDVRMTTRFHEDNLGDSLSSTMHEAGHGLYNQNLPAAYIGLPMGRPVGLSIHESQSRLWENHVGRSRAFWEWAYPMLSQYFGSAFDDFTIDQVYQDINVVKPGFIRVEADEATYNLHIMIRFELERAMLKGELAVADLPGAWNALYREYLGLDIPDDARGCLQDVHWSGGAMGYFPTYTLGNLHAAQFYEQAQQEIGELESQLTRGEFAPLREWLTQKIYSQGHRYETADLCQFVTGKPLDAQPLLRHLEGKFQPIYGLD